MRECVKADILQRMQLIPVHAHSQTQYMHVQLRQLGIHPVKGTKGKGGGDRDFLYYSEFEFDPKRMQNNCSRLKVGVIGNRRK